jgi:hypothetical protein
MTSWFAPQWLVAPAVVVVVAAVWLVRPEPGAADDTTTYTDPQLDAERHELQAQQEAVAARIAYKEELIDRLIAGEATLEEVAGEFLYLNQGTRAIDMIRDKYPGTDDEEKSARNVIDYVDWRRLPAEQGARLMERLRCEFEQAYRHSPPAAE